VCVGEMSEAAVTEPPRADTESQTLTEPRTHEPRTHAEGPALLAEAAETLSFGDAVMAQCARERCACVCVCVCGYGPVYARAV
jgi:DNA-binding IclR family transcriptional regulator